LCACNYRKWLISQLHIAVLGSPQIYHAGQSLPLPTRKTLALLLYLAVEGGMHPRAHLSRLFWPDSEDAQRQATLRGVLRDIRHALQDRARSELPHVLVRRDALGLDPQQIHLDVQIVQELVAALHSQPAQSTVERLSEVLLSSQGPFLDGWSFGDLPLFEDWIVSRRAY